MWTSVVPRPFVRRSCVPPDEPGGGGDLVIPVGTAVAFAFAGLGTNAVASPVTS